MRGPFVSATAMLMARRTRLAAESQSSRADISRVSTRTKPGTVSIQPETPSVGDESPYPRCGMRSNAVPSHTSHPITHRLRVLGAAQTPVCFSQSSGRSTEYSHLPPCRAGWSRLEIHHCLRTVQAHEAAALSLKARGSLVALLESSK